MGSQALRSRFPDYFQFRHKPAPERMATGISSVDSLCGGFPRGAITEICGPVSCGRTSLLFSVLAQATARGEVCAYVDADDRLDAASAAEAGVELRQLLWVRCGGNPEHALKVTDLLVQAGGFGAIVLDIADIRPEIARRIPLPTWFRLQRALEPTRTAFVILARQPNAKSCASLLLEMKNSSTEWSGAPSYSQLLCRTNAEVLSRKPVRSERAVFQAEALG